MEANGSFTSWPIVPNAEPETEGVVVEEDEDETQEPQEYIATISINPIPHEITDDSNWDIEAYDAAAKVCREIFLQRRNEYGNHLANPKWYDIDCIKIKAWRLTKAILAGQPPKHDTLIDLVNFCLFYISRRYKRTAG